MLERLMGEREKNHGKHPPAPRLRRASGMASTVAKAVVDRRK
jgi:hypothetical protein